MRYLKGPYEQYCSAMDKNVLFDTVFPRQEGVKLRCLHEGICKKQGGCKNLNLIENLEEMRY